MAWQWHQRVEDCSRVGPQILCLRTGYCLRLVAMVTRQSLFVNAYTNLLLECTVYCMLFFIDYMKRFDCLSDVS